MLTRARVFSKLSTRGIRRPLSNQPCHARSFRFSLRFFVFCFLSAAPPFASSQSNETTQEKDNYPLIVSRVILGNECFFSDRAFNGLPSGCCCSLGRSAEFCRSVACCCSAAFARASRGFVARSSMSTRPPFAVFLFSV